MAMATESVDCHRIDHAFIQTNDSVRRDRTITAQDMPDFNRQLRHAAAPPGCASGLSQYGPMPGAYAGSRNLIPEPRHRRPI